MSDEIEENLSKDELLKMCIEHGHALIQANHRIYELENQIRVKEIKVENDNVIKFRKHYPVHYTVNLSHDERGFTVEVLDVADNPQDRKRVAEGLRMAAEMLDDGVNTITEE